MSLSMGLRSLLGDQSNYVQSQVSDSSSTQKQLLNAQNRLNAAGVDYTNQAKPSSNLLLDVLDVLSRTGYGASNLIREFSNPSAGSTPDEFDPFKAFYRGIIGQDKATGKDIMLDLGADDTKGMLGGEKAWWNPSVAGLGGLALDIVNPLDPINWLSFGVGDDIVKGAAKGGAALEKAFGATKGAEITKLLGSVDDVGADSVGKLISQLSTKAQDLDKLSEVDSLIKDGLLETGLKATDKLDYKSMKPISVGLQNPLSIGVSDTALRLPTYEKTGARIPLPQIGKDIKGTFVNVPGSEYLTYGISKIVSKVADTKVGQALGKAFSTAFVPNTVPNSVIKKDLTTSNVSDLISISQTNPGSVPLTAEELVNLGNELSRVQIKNTFDYADNFKVGELRELNKGNYLSIENLAKDVGLKGLTTEDISGLLSDTPFNKSITELYDSLRLINTTGDSKTLFTNAVRLRKLMDLMYDQIPEGFKPFFTGVLKAQGANLYPSDIATNRIGKNITKSPLLAYEFNYNGVPISVVTNSGENFNVDVWAKLNSTIEAIDELPAEAVQAIKGQVEVSPIPIKSPDTSMTLGDSIVLGRIDKPTVAHEFGHVWDNLKGDTNAYTQAILGDAGKTGGTIDTDDLYSDYSRSLYTPENDIGIKEDLADSVSDYMKDRKGFASSYPNRASHIDSLLANVSDSEALAKAVAEQRRLSEQISQIPRTEEQITKIVDSIDKYATKLSFEPGEKAYTSFRKNLSAMFEQTNWKTKQFQQQVEELFRGIDESERKQIMDAAAQINGTEIPKASVAQPNPVFSAQNYPIFYSKLQESVNKMPNSMSVDQFRKFLENNAVKKEEMKWSFIDELLDGKTKISKQEVQDWVNGNTLEVNEVWHTNSDPDASRISNLMDQNNTTWDNVRTGITEMLRDGDTPFTIIRQLQESFDMNQVDAQWILDNYENPNALDTAFNNNLGNPTKFSQYTQPGGEGYTELIFTLPKQFNKPADSRLYSMTDPITSETWEAPKDVLLQKRQDLMDPRLGDLSSNTVTEPTVSQLGEPDFQYEPHWDEVNPVAHTRFDTRYTEDGKKILFVDEIQSDWHQQGRDRGYKDRPLGAYEVFNPQDGKPVKGFDTEQEAQNWIIEQDDPMLWDYSEAGKGYTKGEVADAPFKTSWDEFVQKRLLRYAADNGYDGIAWSTGKQQADRWGQQITEGIDTIQYNHEGHTLRAYKNGEQVITQRVSPEELRGVVGNDVANKLLDTTPDTYTIKPVDEGSSYDLYEQKALEDTQGMGPVEMLRYLEKNPSSQTPSGFRVYDQNGNSWAYVYPSEYDAEVAIENLATVGETMKTVSGANITVGGEGMRKFYDQQIPSNFQRLGKKFGLKVEDIPLTFDKGQELADDLGTVGVDPYVVKNTQKGVWLSPESRYKITQQSFPLFANPDAVQATDDLTVGWSERQINALDNFLKWRNSVVKTYRQMGIPINELEKYVPFIPKRSLKPEEAATLRTVFGTGIKEANADNFDTLLATLQRQDPNLKSRSTKSTRPSEVNSMLKKDWLTEDAAVAMNIRGTRAIKAQEFSNFADDFVKTYGLRTQELDQLKTIPEGYGAYQVGTDVDGNKVFKEISSIPNATEGDFDTVFLPKEMVGLFNEYSNTAFNKYKQNELLNVVDGVNRIYKKTAYLWNPGHILRDFEGNLFNNFLMGVKNPQEYLEGLNVVRGVEGALETPNGPIPYSEVLQKAEEMGIIDSQLANELPSLSGKKESKYSVLMRKGTYATDGWTRATGFIHNLKKGMNYSEAATQTKKFLFDYMDLTTFERRVMKRVFPFYTWMRKNIPLQIAMLLKNPRTYARINDVQNYVSGGEIDWNSKPSYIRSSMAIQPEGSNMYVNPNLPYTDLARTPINLETLGGFLSSTTPLIQTPVETLTNMDWFTGKPLESYPGEQEKMPIVDSLAKLAGVPSNPESGISVPMDSRVTGNLVGSVPIITRISNLLGILAGQPSSDVKKLSQISTTVGGPSLYDATSVDNAAVKEERDRLVGLIQSLNAQGLDVPTTQELQKSSKNRYNRLKSIIAGGK